MEIASTGQTPTQSPQPSHRLALTWARPSIITIAW
jgi:hypothetical protein